MHCGQLAAREVSFLQKKKKVTFLQLTLQGLALGILMLSFKPFDSFNEKYVSI